MQEIWKDIQGYEGLYQISNLGNVKSLSFGPKNIRRSGKERILKSSPSNCGYYKVELYNNGKSKMHYIHRLVATAFIPNPHNKPQINHIDGVKSNNSAANLEWITASENQKHSIRIGLREPSPMTNRKGILHPASHPVVQCEKDGTPICVWANITTAASHFKCNPSSISNCVLGRTRTSMGYTWKYATR